MRVTLCNFCKTKYPIVEELTLESMELTIDAFAMLNNEIYKIPYCNKCQSDAFVSNVKKYYDSIMRDNH